MICEQCKAEGKTSKIYPGMSSSTCMVGQNYYDERGRLHIHDPNTTTTHMRCSNGHEWVETSRSSCLACAVGP